MAFNIHDLDAYPQDSMGRPLVENNMGEMLYIVDKSASRIVGVKNNGFAHTFTFDGESAGFSDMTIIGPWVKPSA